MHADDLALQAVAGPAASTYEYTVRSTAPCAILVFEVEGPTRLEVSALSEADEDSVAAWVAADPLARDVLTRHFEAADERREERHLDRLDAGRHFTDQEV